MLCPKCRSVVDPDVVRCSCGQLLKESPPPTDAQLAVNELQRDRERRMLMQAGLHNKKVGGFWFIAGVAVTLFTMMTTGGGAYIVAWGAIVAGAWQYLRGAKQISEAERDRPAQKMSADPPPFV
jgi:hypothetical protein